MLAFDFTTTSEPSTVNGRSTAPASTRVLSPTSTGPSTSASGEMSEPSPGPHAVAQLEAGDLEVDPSDEDVLVRGAVGLERADVFPVAVDDRAEERQAAVEHRREHVAREVDDLAFGDEVEHARARARRCRC